MLLCRTKSENELITFLTKYNVKSANEIVKIAIAFDSDWKNLHRFQFSNLIEQLNTVLKQFYFINDGIIDEIKLVNSIRGVLIERYIKLTYLR